MPPVAGCLPRKHRRTPATRATPFLASYSLRPHGASSRCALLPSAARTNNPRRSGQDRCKAYVWVSMASLLWVALLSRPPRLFAELGSVSCGLLLPVRTMCAVLFCFSCSGSGREAALKRAPGETKTHGKLLVLVRRHNWRDLGLLSACCTHRATTPHPAPCVRYAQDVATAVARRPPASSRALGTSCFPDALSPQRQRARSTNDRARLRIAQSVCGVG